MDASHIFFVLCVCVSFLSQGLLGEPERANWHECKVEQPDEEAKVAAFKALFKPYEGTKAVVAKAVAGGKEDGAAAAATADDA